MDPWDLEDPGVPRCRLDPGHPGVPALHRVQSLPVSLEDPEILSFPSVQEVLETQPHQVLLGFLGYQHFLGSQVTHLYQGNQYFLLILLGLWGLDLPSHPLALLHPCLLWDL